MRFSILPWIMTYALLSGPAFAQTTDDQAPDAQEKCRAAPDENGNAEPSGDAAGQQTPLTQTLEECRGVLKPPPTGDTDMTAPPPEGGKTPMIKPPDIPEQPPAN
ncbi:MAG: hypothetical protein HYU58_11940 [Proteobacteria bacterium]|nr:hypothetical protein [Pseudomonadota bacterium]